MVLNAGRIQEAALMQASVENWAECLAALHLGQYRGLAALLLHHVGTKGTLAGVFWHYESPMGHLSPSIVY